MIKHSETNVNNKDNGGFWYQKKVVLGSLGQIFSLTGSEIFSTWHDGVLCTYDFMNLLCKLSARSDIFIIFEKSFQVLIDHISMYFGLCQVGNCAWKWISVHQFTIVFHLLSRDSSFSEYRRSQILSNAGYSFHISHCLLVLYRDSERPESLWLKFYSSDKLECIKFWYFYLKSTGNRLSEKSIDKILNFYVVIWMSERISVWWWQIIGHSLYVYGVRRWRNF